MVGKVLFWGMFGLGVRAWQIGIEMRPMFNKESLWVWPIFGGAGASFGYWMEDVNTRQRAVLQMRKDRLLEKRARRAEREEAGALATE